MKNAVRSAWTVLAIILAMAAAGSASPGGEKASSHQCLILVTGAPGTEEYGKGFRDWAEGWEKAARKGGVRLVRIGEGQKGEGEKSDRDRLQEAIEKEARDSAEPLWIVLIGHGTFDGKEAKFNLRGRDVSAAELAAWLEPCGRPLAVIDCASSSGPFINRLSGSRRAIVTATKSGFEYNYARFGRYLAEAMADQGIDIDKDEQISLLEAFLAASARTAEFYKQESRLATEHPLIDDNGDGLGTPAEWFRGIRATRRARDGAPLDGPRANQFLLVRSPADRGLPPDVRQRRDELELSISKLREEKKQLEEDAYYARLEPILLDLARLYEGVERTGKKSEQESGPVKEPKPDESPAGEKK